MTSNQIDTERTVVLFLHGLDPTTQRDLKFRYAKTLGSKTIADSSRELQKTVEGLIADLKRSATRWDGIGLDTRRLLGRQEELNAAISMANPPTKSIAIVGLGGQGKTSFAAALSDALSSAYSDAPWVSLRNGPTLDWVAQRIAHLLGAEISVADATAETATTNILSMLAARRVLLVLDNAETVFNSRGGAASAENAQDLSSHYEYFFRSLAQARLDSLVLVTSRELPNAYRVFPETLRVFRLPGLDEPAVAQLMANSGVTLEARLLSKVHARFLGNPLAIKLLCGLSLDRGAAVVTELLAADAPVSDDISTLMDEHVSRLSREERLFLSKLAWEGGGVEWSVLRELAWPVDSSTAQRHLDHLSRVLLVDSNDVEIAITHPLLREHLVEDVKRQVRLGLLLDDHAGLPQVLSTLLLVNPLADDYVQTLQVAAVESLVADVRRQLGTKHKLRGRILALLEIARRSAHPGYIVANLVEIARRGNVDLHGVDFTGLPLDSVDFRDIDVRDADCSSSEFRSCVFGDNFGPVTAVARVAAGQELLAAGTFEGFVRLWTADGELQSVVKCADDWLSAISPVARDGVSYFAAVDGAIGSVRWSNLSVTTLLNVDAQVRGLAVVNDVLVAACADGSIRVVDLNTGRARKLMVATFRLKVVRAIPGTARSVVVLGGDSGDLLVFDVEGGKELSRFTNGTAWVRDALFDAAGSTLFTADDDGRVRAWERQANDEFRLKTEAGHSHRVWCLALDQHSARLFSAGNDAVIRVWDANSLKQLDLYEGHGSWIRSMALLDDGRVLASGSEDQTLRFWHTEDGKCFRRRTGYARRVFAIGFASEDVLICGTGDHKLVKFDLGGDTPRTSYFDGHRDQVFSLAVERRSNRVASASDDGEVRISDASTGDSLFAERLHTGWIGSVAFSPSGLRLASGADDRTIVVLDAVHFTPINRRRTNEGRISSIVFAAEDVIVCSSEDGTIRVLAVPDLSERGCHALGAGPLYAVGLIEKGTAAIAAGVGGKVWRVPMDSVSPAVPVAELPVNAIWSIDVSPDGQMAALGADDGSVVLLEVDSKQARTIAQAHQRQVWCVRWSPNGSTIATASEDGEVALWNPQGASKARLRPPLLYHGLRITGSEGLSPAERRHLLAMGAVP
ncbi:MAG TPA: WD40 repeat domain-containing protein [Vicinamibacterales bacterium]|nr:WD40 repeat domain-containing protein [Vicinamibacterales bacterium]